MVYKRKRILIVDDEFNIRRTLSDILTFRGYETISTDTGEKALEMAEKEKPCLVLLDMKLEDMSGLDILKYIKLDFGQLGHLSELVNKPLPLL